MSENLEKRILVIEKEDGMVNEAVKYGTNANIVQAYDKDDAMILLGQPADLIVVNTSDIDPEDVLKIRKQSYEMHQKNPPMIGIDYIPIKNPTKDNFFEYFTNCASYGLNGFVNISDMELDSVRLHKDVISQSIKEMISMGKSESLTNYMTEGLGNPKRILVIGNRQMVEQYEHIASELNIEFHGAYNFEMAIEKSRMPYNLVIMDSDLKKSSQGFGNKSDVNMLLLDVFKGTKQYIVNSTAQNQII